MEKEEEKSPLGRRKEQKGYKCSICPGWDILMAGNAGWDGSMKLARLYEKELTSRFCNGFLDPLIKGEEGVPAEGAPADEGLLPERIAGILKGSAGKADSFSLCPAGEGGVFAALWNMAARAGLGLRVFLESIPIRQETVEVCEFLDVNPYQLMSGSVVLIAAQGAERVRHALEEAGITAAVIGYFTDDKDRLVLFGGKHRFLEPFRGDSFDQAKVTQQHR